MATLSEFKAQLQGGARPSLYNVTLAFPASIAGQDAATKLQFTCKGAQLPGVSTGQIEAPYMGRKVKMAGDATFQDITLTILNDVDWTVRTAFERWSNLINNHAENRGAVRLQDYAVDVMITQLDRDGNDVATYVLISAYPSDIGAIDLGYDQVDTIEEFSVTLAYSWWERSEAGIA